MDQNNVKRTIIDSKKIFYTPYGISLTNKMCKMYIHTESYEHWVKNGNWNIRSKCCNNSYKKVEIKIKFVFMANGTYKYVLWTWEAITIYNGNEETFTKFIP